MAEHAIGSFFYVTDARVGLCRVIVLHVFRWWFQGVAGDIESFIRRMSPLLDGYDESVGVLLRDVWPVTVAAAAGAVGLEWLV